jgi:16S rRNA (guanine527-N7)-methyltransferase
MSDADARLDRLAALIGDSPHNLVSRAERPHVRARHVEEAVLVGAVLPLASGQRWLDLGTGGGLPGLVLAILRPEISFTLLDSVAKKTRAVLDFASVLGLANVTVVTGRAERVARDVAHRGRYQGVISRALADLVVAAELSRGFVDTGGVVAAVKGPRWPEELDRARPGLARLRLRYEQSLEVVGAARPTWLVTMRATGPCPREIPRREGVPRAQPLGDART